ncbi:MAG: 2OG-Fe(II) oxygenase [Pseudomonadota bacterium]
MTSTDAGKAAELDAQNQHQAAVELLVKAVNQGDVGATLQLGKRFLIGDRAPLNPSDAFQLFNRATTLGSAEAPALLSSLYALGYQCQQSWQGALETLALAAFRGHTSSQDQLLLLTSNRKLAAQRSASADFWREITQGVNLQDWTTPPSHSDLSTNPLIRVYPEFASKEVCQWLIKRARPRLDRAKVYDAVHQQVTTHHTRTNSSASFELLDTDLVNILLQHRMANSLGAPIRNFEVATVLHYAPGEEITEHFDFIDPHVPDYEQQVARSGQRIVTFLVYLNDNYDGGETEFPRLGIRHKARRGDGLFFVNVLPDSSPNLQTMHAGRPPLNHDKWIVSQFVRNGQFF